MPPYASTCASCCAGCWSERDDPVLCVLAGRLHAGRRLLQHSRCGCEMDGALSYREHSDSLVLGMVNGKTISLGKARDAMTNTLMMNSLFDAYYSLRSGRKSPRKLIVSPAWKSKLAQYGGPEDFQGAVIHVDPKEPNFRFEDVR